MKKKLSTLLLVATMACATFAMPVAAAEPMPNDVHAGTVSMVPFANSSFSGSTRVLNALNGGSSIQSPISSGTVSPDARITGVTVNATVSSGSASSTLYVRSPGGKTASRTLGGSSATLNFTEFNTENPSGTWNVWIVTNGTVTTVNARMTVNYSF